MFAFYLIYVMVKEAIMNSMKIPTFLLIYGKTSRYYLSVGKDDVPIASIYDSSSIPDYIISDKHFDQTLYANKWNMLIHSYGSNVEVQSFIDAVFNNGDPILTMGVMPYEEVVDLANEPRIGTFSYTVFGGSARFLRAMENEGCICEYSEVAMEIEGIMKGFFKNTEYDDPTFESLKRRACWIIASTLAGKTPRASSVFRSMFQHTFMNLKPTTSGDYEYCESISFASSFMRELDSYFVEKANVCY